ncbi:hypothetical protein [Cryobacterium sp. PH31-L1]|uniref:hypothetical protein n=1 Tax=Cryobacterium sp. PH31-L1 TaxID=3046199 RepID=UPI0024B884EC|nr:hypothetical protein [Cryobacterium sp. PH31-L1]MDJ0377456.1 hypothetical protein [Cryobacterium sp. PH31-L1]
MFHGPRRAPAAPLLLALLCVGLLSSAVLSGCTAGASASPPGGSPTATAAEDDVGVDIGNGRPTVSFDGPMVRRRVVLAVEADADPPALRARLEQRASAAQLVLADISPDVLPAGVLEQGVPQLTELLSMGATEDQARTLLSSTGPTNDQYFVLSVLVHDLRFAVSSADPVALADAIAREGILSDALGNYGTTVDANTLNVTYLGALLGDDVVNAVRNGMARAAGLTADQVRVTAGTLGGAGVDMATEPEPAQVAIAENGSGHGHDATAATAAPTQLSVNVRLLYGIGLAILLLASATIVLWATRRRVPASEIEPEPRDRE